MTIISASNLNFCDGKIKSKIYFLTSFFVYFEINTLVEFLRNFFSKKKLHWFSPWPFSPSWLNKNFDKKLYKLPEKTRAWNAPGYIYRKSGRKVYSLIRSWTVLKLKVENNEHGVKLTIFLKQWWEKRRLLKKLVDVALPRRIFA